MGPEPTYTIYVCPECGEQFPPDQANDCCTGADEVRHGLRDVQRLELVPASVLEERDRTIEHLREREAYFAKVLHVADGGQYRADWDGRLQDIVNERAELRSQLTEARAFLDQAREFARVCIPVLEDDARKWLMDYEKLVK